MKKLPIEQKGEFDYARCLLAEAQDLMFQCEALTISPIRRRKKLAAAAALAGDVALRMLRIRRLDLKLEVAN